MIKPIHSTWIHSFLPAFEAWLGRRRVRARRAFTGAREDTAADEGTVPSHLIASAERDRKWLAMEMHDGLGQYLLRVKNVALIGAEHQEASPSIVRRFEEISMITSKAIDAVRNIAADLRPEELDRFGLTQALLTMVETSSSEVNTRFILEIDDIDELMPREKEIYLFRVAQESVNNIIKHSNADRAGIEIARNDFSIDLTIWDDGIGFDPARLAKTIPSEMGFGLSNMKERVKILGGELRVFSKANAGTILRASIPIDNEGAARKNALYDACMDGR